MKDKDGWTSLHVAALKHEEGLVRVLLDRVDDGNDILDWAELQQQDSRLQAMREEAAEKKAVASIAITGLRETVQERQVGRSQVLLDKGADVNGKDVGGSTGSDDSCLPGIRGIGAVTARQWCRCQHHGV